MILLLGYYLNKLSAFQSQTPFITFALSILGGRYDYYRVLSDNLGSLFN